MKSLAEFLEREGGQICILGLLTVGFAVSVKLFPSDTPFFEKIALPAISTFSGALIMVMKGNGNGKHTPQDSQPTIPPQPEPPKTP